MPLFGAVEHTPATPGLTPPPVVTVEEAPRRPVIDRIERLQNMVGEPLNARTRHVIENEVRGALNEVHELQNGGYLLTSNTGVGITHSANLTLNGAQDLANYLRLNGVQCDVRDMGGGSGVVQIIGGTGYGPGVTLTTATTTAGTTLNTWNHWNVQYTATTAYPYNFFTTSATSITNYSVEQAVWNQWVETGNVIRDAGSRADQIRRYSRRQMTDEELRAELEREKRMREEAERRAAEARKAQETAEALLLSCLSPQQREDLQKKNCFYIVVDGKNGKQERYRIDRGSHGNVKQIDEKGSIIRSFCIQPEGVPVGDILLTQKLWLEASDETREKFWETANITTLMKEKEVPHHIPRPQRRRYAEEHGLLH